MGVGGAGMGVGAGTITVGVAGTGDVTDVAVGLSGTEVAVGDGGATVGARSSLQAEAIASAANTKAQQSTLRAEEACLTGLC